MPVAQTPDAHRILRQVLVYTLTTVFLLLLYFIGVSLAFLVFHVEFGLFLVSGALVAILIAVSIPLMGLTRHVVDRFMPHEQENDPYLVKNLIQLNREVREAYQALDRANRNLARLDQTKSDFISLASHELRTPLTVLRGYTEMLLEDPIIRQNPTHYQTVDGIHKGTERLHEITDSMFDIAQIDARTLDLHLTELKVPDLLKSVCEGLSKIIAERKQTLMIDLPPLPTIKADPDTLCKVFYHLVTNAIKFTPDGGRIAITGQPLPPNRRDLPEGGVEIIVADTGVGIDPDSLDLVFTKFYQIEENLNKHSSGKSKFKGGGTGLGLALSKGIVEAHGGRIWVESQGYDEINFPGSQFHVVLPMRMQGESATVRMSDAMKEKL